MRTDVLDLHGFYESPLGAAARDYIAAWLVKRWGEAAHSRIAGFGYASPYLGEFDRAERVIIMAPAAQGVMRWPATAENRASLVDEYRWPLPDASIDRLLIVHGLEESGDPRRLMREAWRVLANNGRLIVVAAHRRGLWSMIETTPFAAGRPYLRRQLRGLLNDTLFQDEAWSSALHFPPFGARFLLRAAAAWERAGSKLWPGLGGVQMAEATKSLTPPLVQVQRVQSGALRPAAVRPAAFPIRAAQRQPSGARLEPGAFARLYRGGDIARRWPRRP